MDVISLSKAINTIKEIVGLNENTIGSEAEKHFKTVDHRLDWIEAQAEKSSNRNIDQINLKKGNHLNLTIRNKKIHLKEFDYIEDESKILHSFRALSSGNRNPYRFEINLNEYQVVTKYSVNTPYTVMKNRIPRKWTFEGKNNNGHWEVLDEVLAHSAPSISRELANTKSYQTYSLYVTENNGHSNTLISSLDIFGPNLVQTYASEGTWTSPIIDLGVGWQKTNLIDIIKQEADLSTVKLEIASSENGVDFTSFIDLDENNLPQERYLKLKATLSAPVAIQGEDKSLIFDQSNEENIVTLNKYTEANGILKLKNNYEVVSSEPNSVEKGNIFEFPIDKSKFKNIYKIGVD